MESCIAKRLMELLEISEISEISKILFVQALAFAHRLGLSNRTEWRAWCGSGARYAPPFYPDLRHAPYYGVMNGARALAQYPSRIIIRCMQYPLPWLAACTLCSTPCPCIDGWRDAAVPRCVSTPFVYPLLVPPLVLRFSTPVLVPPFSYFVLVPRVTLPF